MGPITRHDTSLAVSWESMPWAKFQKRCPRRAGVFKRQTGLRTRHPQSPAACRVALVVRSGISCQTLEDSLQSGTPLPRSLPTRRWSAVVPFFHPPSSAAQGSERSERLAGRDGPTDRSHAAGQQAAPEEGLKSALERRQPRRQCKRRCFSVRSASCYTTSFKSFVDTSPSITIAKSKKFRPSSSSMTFIESLRH